MTCKAPGCDRPQLQRRSLCSMHLYRWKTFGSYDCPPRFVFLPVEPLVRLVDGRGEVVALCAGDWALRQAYVRVKSRGTVSLTVADRLAVKLLGLHPSEVWDDWWEKSA